MRVQNEGTGKSSWWVLNPEAKPGKSPRRRATSMDTKEYAKKRGRVKRKVDQLRAAMEGDTSSYGSTHELTDPFCLSPNEYRQRASSNASSLGGRLSPITSQYGEFDDTIPDGPWSRPLHDPGFSEISETFAGMLMEDYNDVQWANLKLACNYNNNCGFQHNPHLMTSCGDGEQLADYLTINYVCSNGECAVAGL